MCTDCGCNPSPLAPAPSPISPSRLRTIQLEETVLARNDVLAKHNRAHFQASGISAINLLAAPGAGKTTLLEKTLIRLRERTPALSCAVIEGDQQTSFDAERIRQTGVTAVQVNTGQGCHLDARMVRSALDEIYPPPHSRTYPDSLLFIENIGNLVCPALWDLGEDAKVVVYSVTEGDEKPLKYPDMFAAASLILINKIDLLDYVDFQLDRAIERCRSINPASEILSLSATRGDGLEAWIDWLLRLRSRQLPIPPQAGVLTGNRPIRDTP